MVLRLPEPGNAAHPSEIGDRVAARRIRELRERNIAGRLRDTGREMVIVLEEADGRHLLERMVPPILVEMIRPEVERLPGFERDWKIRFAERSVVRLLLLASEVLTRLDRQRQREAVPIRHHGCLQRAGAVRVVLHIDLAADCIVLNRKRGSQIPIRAHP